MIPPVVDGHQLPRAGTAQPQEAGPGGRGLRWAPGLVGSTGLDELPTQAARFQAIRARTLSDSIFSAWPWVAGENHSLDSVQSGMHQMHLFDALVGASKISLCFFFAQGIEVLLHRARAETAAALGDLLVSCFALRGTGSRAKRCQKTARIWHVDAFGGLVDVLRKLLHTQRFEFAASATRQKPDPHCEPTR